ncbi:DUF3276 family protein [Puteibacter caeruleilacunae]|nr:DUF3276 family protein [Puteibacter caeruleilacunae]
MESTDKKDGMERFKEEIFSKAVRAGKRTYFFDVKATRKNEYYLTVTESKKKFEENGKFSYEKHKIFLYKEDFDKFADGLAEVVSFIKANQPAGDDDRDDKKYVNVEFEDLEVK